MVLCHQHPVAGDACGGSLYHHITTEVHFVMSPFVWRQLQPTKQHWSFSKTEICNKLDYVSWIRIYTHWNEQKQKF